MRKLVIFLVFNLSIFFGGFAVSVALSHALFDMSLTFVQGIAVVALSVASFPIAMLATRLENMNDWEASRFIRGWIKTFMLILGSGMLLASLGSLLFLVFAASVTWGQFGLALWFILLGALFLAVQYDLTYRW